MKKYQGKNLDDVLKKIASENNCDLAAITYEIIDEHKGILGIGNSITVAAYVPEDIKNFIFEYLGNYFTELNQAVKIEIIEEKDNLKVLLDAENNAVVIGKGGQTLRAINQVLRSACNVTFKKRVNLTVDINNYKEERYKKVKLMAKRIALEVRKSKVDAELDPLPADERKIIHQYLGEFKNIKTESIDDGNDRHIVIRYVNEE